MTDWLRVFPSHFEGPDVVIKNARNGLFTQLQSQTDAPPFKEPNEMMAQQDEDVRVDNQGVLILLGDSFPRALHSSYARQDNFNARIKVNPDERVLIGLVDIGDTQRNLRLEHAAGEIAHAINLDPVLSSAARTYLMDVR